MKTLTVTLNGQKVAASAGMTLLELSEANGIYIPRLCHHPLLKPAGACRICLVEDKTKGKLVASCVTPVADGMVIETDSTRVREAREFVIKLILSCHPDSCLVCDKGTICDLRRIASELNVGQIDFANFRRFYPVESANQFILRDLSKCILCGKCIRACQELVLVGAIDYAYRGFNSKPATNLDTSLEESSCNLCGTCLDICPVGALLEKLPRSVGRWERKKQMVCPWCSALCDIHLYLRGNTVVKSGSLLENSQTPVICAKGRFGYDLVGHANRLRKPLVKKNGEFSEVEWEEGLSFIAQRFQQLRERYGPQAIGGIGSLYCTNEDNYLFQKFMRVVLGTNNVGVLPSGLIKAAELFGAGFLKTLEEIKTAEIVIVAGDLVKANPLAGLKVKEVVRKKGAKLIYIGPKESELVSFATLWQEENSAKAPVIVLGLVGALLGKEELAAFKKREEKAILSKRITKAVNLLSASRRGSKFVKEVKKLFKKEQKISLLVEPFVNLHTQNVWVITALATLLKNSSLIFLPIGGNGVGACDMGLIPYRLPGYHLISDKESRRFLEDRWNSKLPVESGLTAEEMLREESDLKALYIMGSNPVHLSQSVEKRLKKLDFLVVQDIFLTETAKLADIVLPAACYAEKDGSYTDQELFVKYVEKAVDPPGEARSDAEIIALLSAELGYEMSYAKTLDISAEIAEVVPAYTGLSERKILKSFRRLDIPVALRDLVREVGSENLTEVDSKLVPSVFKHSYLATFLTNQGEKYEEAK